MPAMNPVPKPLKRPLLLVVSAPSGGGKTTLCDRLLANDQNLVYSVSCTTRAPRGEEVDGHDYHFLSDREFNRRLQAGQFLEHAQVHGCQYGTLRKPVVDALRAGRDVLMDIDVQGASQLRQAAMGGRHRLLREAIVDVFIVPPTLNILRGRLIRRSEDSPETIARRLKTAVEETKRWREYQYLVINDRLRDAYEQLRAIIVAERCRIV